MSLNSTRPKISALIVDDEAELRRSLAALLQSQMTTHEFSFVEAGSGQEAVSLVEKNEFDLVLMDVKMPGMSGLEALEKIKAKDPSIFVVIMTAHSNLQDAVTAIREGAYDYLEKPVNPSRLTEIVQKSLEAREMVSNLALSNPIFDDDVDSEFVGQSQNMRLVFDLIYKLCRVETTVLIRGENGTGKELVARAIHFNSPRKSGPFIAVNCGALPENLVESEFFGHEKGAFTGATERKIGHFQQANNGTLFLDEIGELRPEMQVKFLRVLQEKKFFPVGSSREVKTSTRIIAATNRNLEKMIQDGQFREDLFYRLNVMPIFLPPLRERKDDIAALVQSFIRKFAKTHPHSAIRDLSPVALEILKQHRWPGNIRELENVIERAFIVESTAEIQPASLPEGFGVGRAQGQGSNSQGGFSQGSNSLGGISQGISPQGVTPHGGISQGPPTQSGYSQGAYSQAVSSHGDSSKGSGISPPAPTGIPGAGTLDYESFKESSEKEFVINALKANKGRINQTVAQANIPKNTLLRKIKKYGINVREISGKDLTETPD